MSFNLHPDSIAQYALIVGRLQNVRGEGGTKGAMCDVPYAVGPPKFRGTERRSTTSAVKKAQSPGYKE